MLAIVKNQEDPLVADNSCNGLRRNNVAVQLQIDRGRNRGGYQLGIG
jgi:hypothetical protein